MPHRGQRFEIALPNTHVSELSFAFTLPRSITPSYAASTHELAWDFCAAWLEPGVLWESRTEILTVPVHVMGGNASASPPPAFEAPAVGGTRHLEALRAVGMRTGMREVDGMLEGSAPPDGRLRLRAGWVQAEGSWLEAHIEMPSLEIGLEVRPTTALQSLLSGDISVGLPAWDRTHHVEGREVAQVSALIGPLVHALKFDSIELHFASDERIVLRRADPLRSAAALESFVQAVLWGIPKLRDFMEKIPSMSGLRLDEAGMRDWARELQGEYVPGNAGIRVSRPDLPSIQMGAWANASGPPRSYLIEVQPLAGSLVSGQPPALPAPVLEGLRVQASLEGGTGKVVIEAASDVLVVDASQLRACLDWLLALSAHQTQAGAFR